MSHHEERSKHVRPAMKSTKNTNSTAKNTELNTRFTNWQKKPLATISGMHMRSQASDMCAQHFQAQATSQLPDWSCIEAAKNSESKTSCNPSWQRKSPCLWKIQHPSVQIPQEGPPSWRSHWTCYEGNACNRQYLIAYWKPPSSGPWLITIILQANASHDNYIFVEGQASKAASKEGTRWSPTLLRKWWGISWPRTLCQFAPSGK